MIVAISILFFTAISTVTSLLLCLVFGTLNSLIAWISLACGMIAGFFAFRECSKAKIETQIRLTFFDKLIAIFFTLFCFRQFFWIYFYKEGGIWTLNWRHNYSDLPLHLTYIANFANGAKFWPVNPIVSGEKLTYHFGIDLFTALFVKAGVPLSHALPLIGLAGGILTLLALLYWGRGFAAAAFLFSGGMAGYMIFGAKVFDDYQADVSWKSLPLTLLIPQRGFLFGFPAGLILLWLWRRRFLEKPKRNFPFWVEGLLWGILPLFQVHTFLFVSVLFLVWSIATKKISEAVPVYVTAALPAIFLMTNLTDGFGMASHVFLKPGWVMENQNPLLFVILNWGFFFPLSFYTIYAALRSKNLRILLITLPAFVLFFFFMTVMLQPFAWDNIKMLAWCYLLLLPVMDELAVQKLKPLFRYVLLFLLFLSGFVSIVGTCKASNKGVVIIDRKEQDEICQMLKEIPAGERFAVAQDFKHPVLLCGYPVAVGWNGHIWSHGTDPGPLESRLNQLMNGDSGWQDQAKALGVRYLFWGKREQAAYAKSSQPWKSSARKVKESPQGILYDLQNR